MLSAASLDSFRGTDHAEPLLQAHHIGNGREAVVRNAGSAEIFAWTHLVLICLIHPKPQGMLLRVLSTFPVNFIPLLRHPEPFVSPS
jgi:hypothetical protein